MNGITSGSSLAAQAANSRRAAAPDELPVWQMLVYALPSITLSFLFVPLVALLPAFYAKTLGMSLSAVGGVLMLSRVADLVIDPLLGKLSDSTRTRWGRRKPWMVIGSPILMIGAALTFMPMNLGLTPGNYLLLASFVIYLGGSTLGLAYSAWGAEVVASYHGRAKVAGYREVAGVVGIVLASSVPAITAIFGHGVDRFTMGLLGWLIILITPLSVWASIALVPEPAIVETARINWWKQIRGLGANGPFLNLCGAFLLTSFGGSVATTTLIFYITHYLKAPAVIGPVLLASFASVMGFVPFWLWVSKRIGKHRAAGISLILAILMNVAVVLVLKPGDGWLFVGCMAVAGGCSAGYLTLPLGMMGDIIDYDSLKTGAARGGLYFGIWSFVQKLTPALAVGVTLWSLTQFGFDPAAKGSTSGLEALKYVFGLGSAPFFLAGALLLLVFPLDSRRHGIIRKRLEARKVRDARALAVQGVNGVLID